MLPAVNYYHKALHLGRCSSPRSASAMMLFFKNKEISKERINLAENGETLSNSQKISKTLNTLFFENPKIKQLILQSWSFLMFYEA